MSAAYTSPALRALLEIHARDTDEPYLPDMENIPADRFIAAAVAIGETLTRQIVAAPTSISATSGRMETSAPLFRDSPANPQRSLF